MLPKGEYKVLVTNRFVAGWVVRKMIEHDKKENGEEKGIYTPVETENKKH